MPQDYAVVSLLARDKHGRAAQIALDSRVLRDLFPSNVVHRFIDSVLANRLKVSTEIILCVAIQSTFSHRTFFNVRVRFTFMERSICQNFCGTTSGP